jgi:four helix bundle protein
MEAELARLQSYRELIAWQKAMSLVTTIYQLSASWPSEERFGLTAQIRRAAVSIPSNIAEGHGRRGTKEFLNHLSIGYGSLMELETQLLISGNLLFSTAEQLSSILSQAAEVGRLLNGLMSSLSELP